VESVGTGTGDDVGGRAQAVSELGVGVVGKNSELGDGVHGRLENETSIDTVEIVGSIDKKVVRLGPLPVRRIGLAGAQGASSFLQAGSQGDDSGLKQAELSKIASVEGQVKNFLLGDRLAQAGYCALN